MKTALYIRVSTQEQVKEGYSLQSQKNKLIAYCEAKSWEITKIYADEGISGKSLKSRPSVMQLLEDAKSGEFENVLIFKIDRLCRNTKDLLTIVEKLKKYNVSLNALDENIDTETASGKLALTMLGSIAEFERSTITTRMKMGKEQQLMSGYKPKTAYIAFGFMYENKQYKPDPVKSEYVKELYQRLINGASLRSLTIDLYKTYNLNFYGSKIKRLFTNPLYIGYAKVNGKLYKLNNVEPFIDEETFKCANRIIEARAGEYKNVRKFSSEKFHFGDVAYCGKCGCRLGSYFSYNVLYYRCRSNHEKFRVAGDEDYCRLGFVSARKMNQFFLDYMSNITPILQLKEKEIIDRQAIRSGLEEEKQALNRKKQRLTEKLIDEIIDDEEYRRLLIVITNQLVEVNKKIEETYKNDANIDIETLKEKIKKISYNVEKYWNIMNDVEKRAFVTTNIKKIYVLPDKIANIEFVF